MKSFGFAALLFVLATASRATAQDVFYSFDQGTDFSKFQTYKWVNVNGPESAEDVNDRQIRFAIDQELAKKGLLKSESDKADLYVACQSAGDAPKQLRAYEGWNYGPRWGGTPMAKTASDTLQVGQLDIDMYDSANKVLVWRGVVSKAIDTKANPDKRQKNLQKLVEKLLSNYPPKAK